ncbi:shikimate kinase [Pseudanabaena sp. UWO310]|uniref:shikimate kinase n=1 Tax=Pseudanabaena sp. UWO310 TaxID=2480795 RepID=UPI001157830C|nr:shikimate kinase [Pseudanabaena sp. UWO310]TYQ28539.1 shikimate kinase [Pseudanabaena sp. UWO310]
MLNGTNIFLVGMMGAGKSTIGKLLAQKLGYNFVDTDPLIEQCAGKSITDIFTHDGEELFRDLEQQVLSQVSSYTRLVVATGGGIVLRSLNWSHLHDGIVVWIDVPVDVLHERLKAESEHRPLLQTENPLQKLTDIYEQRRDRYAQADISIMVDASEAIESVSDRLLSMIQSRIVPDRLKQDTIAT